MLKAENAFAFGISGKRIRNTSVHFGNEDRTMSEIDVIANQKRILQNQKAILANQKTIKANQEIIKKNQASILKNQGTLATIVKNQRKILEKIK